MRRFCVRQLFPRTNSCQYIYIWPAKRYCFIIQVYNRSRPGRAESGLFVSLSGISPFSRGDRGRLSRTCTPITTVFRRIHCPRNPGNDARGTIVGGYVDFGRDASHGVNRATGGSNDVRSDGIRPGMAVAPRVVPSKLLRGTPQDWRLQERQREFHHHRNDIVSYPPRQERGRGRGAFARLGPNSGIWTLSDEREPTASASQHPAPRRVTRCGSKDVVFRDHENRRFRASSGRGRTHGTGRTSTETAAMPAAIDRWCGGFWVCVRVLLVPRESSKGRTRAEVPSSSVCPLTSPKRPRRSHGSPRPRSLTTAVTPNPEIGPGRPSRPRYRHRTDRRASRARRHRHACTGRWSGTRVPRRPPATVGPGDTG